MPRFYVEGCQDAQTGITIMGEDVNHIKNVLRLTIGDTITVCDGAGKEYECEIAEISKEQVYANIVDINQNAAELPCNITLFQGMPKSDKMEFIIQKAVELGVSAIVPLITDRTIVRLNAREAEAKRQKWQRIALEACKQCGQNTLPAVELPVPFAEWLGRRAGRPECDCLPGARCASRAGRFGRSARPFRKKSLPAGRAGRGFHGAGNRGGPGGGVRSRDTRPHRPAGGNGRLFRGGRHAVRAGLSFPLHILPCSRI